MTENERFIYYERKGADYILDNPNTELDFIEMLGDSLEAEEIVDLLNEQEEVITNLRLSIEVTGKAYRKSVKDYEEFIEELEKENVQLKEIKERYDETIVDWNALKSEYDDLKNENEQLKKKNKLLARFIRRNHDVTMISRILNELGDSDD